MEKWQNKVVLVTGASKGLGKCIAQILANYGMIVVACARSMDKLQELVKNCKGKPGEAGSIDAVRCDMSKVEDILRLFKHIEQKYRTLHACVNNAGLGTPDYFLPIQSNGKYDRELEDKDKGKIYEDWKYLLEVNVLGLAICSKESINLMAKSGVKDGLIVNVSSIVGQQVILMKFDDKSSFYSHMYIASKHAVTAITQCLRLEVQQHPYANATRIVTLYPGVIKTDFIDNDDRGKSFYEKYSFLTPEDVCDAMLAAFRCSNSVQIDGITINPACTPGKLS
ncbi:unnamed protein product [Gordionus sp. m RMFG-2023]|uniref:dehydrogenase/reductase SDR family member 11-like n=1 Tax=Gordionus sp. m RMFG-2023 TaxID=3053472 RepID=UPI0030DE0461